MNDYRIYVLGNRNQIACPSVIVRLPSDADAFLEAMQMSTSTQGVEVWCDGRLVSSVPPVTSLNRAEEWVSSDVDVL